jgi:putative membrane protein
MTRSMITLLGATSLLVALANGARAVEDPRPPDVADAPSGAPKTFVAEAAQGGLAEVELGELAQQKASSAAVKSFAGQMVADHGKANAELAQLAKQEDVEMPKQLDAKHQALRDRLAKLSGAEFDRAYMKEMVHDHEKDVAEFSQAAKSATDPQVKEFASKTLPTLEGHLRMAKEVEKSL